MKVIAICGSPRQGNTEFVLKRMLIQAEKTGASVELVLLRNKRIEFCNGCLTCDSTGSCNIRDDMQMIYSKLKESDMIILGSPTYFDNVSGMMKNFIDRLNPLLKDKQLNEKKVYAVSIGEEMRSNKLGVIGYFENISNEFGMNLSGDISFVAKEPGDIENDSEKIAQIDQFSQNIFT